MISKNLQLNEKILEDLLQSERQVLIRKLLDQKLISKSTLTSNKSDTCLNDVLTNKLVGFYFDANWCSPGNKFLQDLNRVYSESRTKGFKFELIYVSLDDNETTCLETFKNSHGDWFLWPFEKESINDLKKFLKIKYLPSLAIVNTNFKLVTSTGRKEIHDKGLNAINYWDYICKKV